MKVRIVGLDWIPGFCGIIQRATFVGRRFGTLSQFYLRETNHRPQFPIKLSSQHRSSILFLSDPEDGTGKVFRNVGQQIQV